MLESLEEFFKQQQFGKDALAMTKSLRDGHRLPWKEGQPSLPFEWKVTDLNALPPAHQVAILADVEEGIQDGSFSQVDSFVPKAICKLRGEEQNEKIRTIHILCSINDKLQEERCSVRYEDIRCARMLIKKFMTKIDLQKGYRNLSVCKDDRTYLAFVVQGKTFVCNVLPFGLASAPKAFTDLLTGLKVKWRLMGALVVIYLDDFLIAADSFEEWFSSVSLVVNELIRFGFFLNKKKFFLGPYRRIEFLGAVLDSDGPTITVSAKKVEKAVSLIEDLLPSFALDPLQKFLGFLSFLGVGVFGTRLFRRYLDSALQSLLAGHQPSSHLLTAASAEALFWKENLLQLRSKKVSLEAFDPHTLYTDASDTGWGAILVKEGSVVDMVAGNFSAQESSLSSTAREILAVRGAFERFSFRWKGKSVVMLIDNASAVASLKGTFSRALETVPIMQELAWNLRDNTIDIFPIHCPRDCGFLPAADHLSRCRGLVPPHFKLSPPVQFHDPFGQTEWELNNQLFDSLIVPLLSLPFIDVFASSSNRKSPHFCSLIDEPGSLGNGLAFNWSRKSIYAFPPFSLLELVIAKISSEKPQVTVLITKDVSLEPIWPLLSKLSRSPPRFISRRRGLLYLNGRKGEPLLDLFVWRVSQ